MRNFKAAGFAVSVGAALFVGATSFMPSEVYGSWWWFAFWAAVGMALLIIIIRRRLWRQSFPVFMLHLALLLILCGGGVTALTARSGVVHLTPGVAVSDYVGADGTLVRLPFTLTLERFEAEYYPGMNFPRDFHTTVDCDGRRMEISMNRIGRAGGWRLYQQSFDGRGGSILSVSHDPVGTGLTYAGYLLFALGGLGVLLSRRRLRGRAAAVAAVIVLAAGTAQAAPAVSRATGDSLRARQVEFHGRIVPFATMASELTFKLTGRGSVGNLDATRFVASLIAYPQEWAEVEFLKSADGYRSVASLYDTDGEYLPQREYRGGDGPHDKEILRLDEKVALLAELWSGRLFTPLAADSDLRLPRWRVRAEVAYVSIQPVRWFFMLALGLALVCLLFRRLNVVVAACTVFVAGAVIYAWRWVIAGNMPMAGTGDIMFFVAVCMAAISAVVGRRSKEGGALGLLMGGFAGLMSWLAVKNPVMTPLMPVLASPWLSVHVTLVMISYALLGITFPAAAASLAFPRLRARMTELSLRLVGPGVYILGLGIFVGAMWANVSWGRYWAWDPKETWALVTMLLYSVTLHPSLGLRQKSVLLNFYLLFAFLSVVMTYAGVNYLPSLHAYR